MTNLTAYLNNFDRLTNVKIVAAPQKPTKRTGKSFIFFLLLGCVGGLVTGLGLTLFFELVDTAVRRKQVVENLTGVPVICRIGKLSPG